MSKESALAALTGQPVPSSPSEPVVTETAPPVQDIPSKAFGHLAKKEAELVRLREEFKKEREMFTSERDKFTPVVKQYQEYVALKEKDPIAAMKMIGFSEADIFNYMSAQQPEELTPEQKAIQAAENAASAKIKEFEDNQAKKILEQQNASDAALIKEYRSNISSAIQGNKEKYEYCAHYGAVAEELIYETVLAVVSESGGKEVPTAEEATAMVEEFYEEQDKQMSQLKKRQPKVEVTAPPPKPETNRSRTIANSATPPSKPVRTLSNSATATAASARPTVNETREQKRDRLIQMVLKGG